MAASVQQSVGGEFRPTEQDKRFIFAAAVAGDGYYVDRIMGQPHFKIRATTDTNTAAGSSNFALDLSAEGLTAATGALTSASSGANRQTRNIFIDVVAHNGANRYKWRQVQRVGVDDSGNAILIGPKTFLTSQRAVYEATVTAGATPSTTETANCRAPEWFDGAAPVAGAGASGDISVQWLGTNSPVGSIQPISINSTQDGAAAANALAAAWTRNHSLTNGTSDLCLISNETTNADGPLAGVVTAHVDVTPPMSVDLFVNTTPTPDTLLVCLVGIASDVVTWQVDVTIGDPFLAVLV